jgi:hypothetical protein
MAMTVYDEVWEVLGNEPWTGEMTRPVPRKIFLMFDRVIIGVKFDSGCVPDRPGTMGHDDGLRLSAVDLPTGNVLDRTSVSFWEIGQARGRNVDGNPPNVWVEHGDWSTLCAKPLPVSDVIDALKAYVLAWGQPWKAENG